MTRRHTIRERPPLDRATLQETALGYASRFATTRFKLAAYLARKVRERGWAEEGPPPFEQLVERMAELGYVDDRAFASMRAASLSRRGYGERRIGQSLRAAGIEAEDMAEARDEARRGGWAAALRYAERRRIGPFAEVEPDHGAREKALASMLRAGHSLDLSRRLVAARPGEVPEPDVS